MFPKIFNWVNLRRVVGKLDLLNGGTNASTASGARANLDVYSKSETDNLVVGLLDDRGNYDASSNTFPSSGGSGAAGAILKGDIWRVSVAGILGGVNVAIGDWFRALSDNPGQTSSNWAIATQGSTISVATLPAGLSILAGSVIKTDSFTTNSSSYVDWTGLSITVSPTTRTNKSKFRIKLVSEATNSLGNTFQFVSLFRSINGGAFSQIALGDAAGSATRCWMDATNNPDVAGNSFKIMGKPISGDFIDAPDTNNSIVYKVQVKVTNGGTACFGRTSDTGDINKSAIPTVFTVEEILQ